MNLVHGPVNGPMRRYVVQYAPRDARVAYLTIPGNPDDETIQRLRRQWEHAHSGLAFVPRVVVLTGGATITFGDDTNYVKQNLIEATTTREGGSKVATNHAPRPVGGYVNRVCRRCRYDEVPYS